MLKYDTEDCKCVLLSICLNLLFVYVQGLDKEWSSLLSLVTHHTVMPEMLPCTLRLPRDTSNPTFKASDKDEREEDPDYQRLADFSSMMEALKM